jgi:hypothetical protein
MRGLAQRLQGQAHQHAIGVGEVANDLANFQREFDLERGNGDDVIPARQVRILQNIDHFDLVTALQVLFAQDTEIGDGPPGLGRLARHKEPQIEHLGLRRRDAVRTCSTGRFRSGHSTLPRRRRVAILRIRHGVSGPAETHLAAAVEQFGIEQS